MAEIGGEGAIMAAQKLGWEVVSVQWVPQMSLDVSVQLLTAKAANPDCIWFTGPATIARDAGRVGLPKDIPLLGCSGTAGPRGFVELSGPEIDRVFTFDTSVIWGESELTTTILREAQQRYRRETIDVFHYIWGWRCTDILIEATRRAVEEVGYQNLSGEAVKEGLDSLKDFDTGAGIASFQDYEGDHAAFEKGRVYKYNHDLGYYTPVSDWIQAPPLPECYAPIS